MPDNNAPGQERKLHERVSAATSDATSIQQLGDQLVPCLTGQIVIDRFNIGLLDMAAFEFDDAYVTGTNVSGRQTGHKRTLRGSVVEAAINNGNGFYFGSDHRQEWVERFPRFGPVFDSGIRAMMAVPVRSDSIEKESVDKDSIDTASVVIASLVFAATDAGAYNDASLAAAVVVADAATPAIIRLGS